MEHNFTTMQYNNYDMSNYPGLPTPPLTSDGSHSPNDYTQECDINAMHISKMDVHKPYLVVVEQPVDRFRFRYKSEMAGTHGCLNGKSSERNKKATFPTVELRNYDKPVIIRCSLYQCNSYANYDRQPHAHRLVVKNGPHEEDDPHDKAVSKLDGHKAVFKNMGIIHTARKFIQDELQKKKTKLRLEEIRRNNPNRQKSDLNLSEMTEIKNAAAEESKTINLNTVCLRFDAFVKQSNDVLRCICDPVYSHPINNLKSALTGELKIVRMDCSTSSAAGGREIYLLVEKVTKKNIKVRFFEVDDMDKTIWSDYAHFNDIDVHHQYAIVIKTPPYQDRNITEQKRVYIELVRPSDGACSEPLEFTYYPDRSVKRKRTESYEYNSTSSYSSSEMPTTVKELPALNVSINDDCWGKYAKGVESDEFRNVLASLGTENQDLFGIPPSFQFSQHERVVFQSDLGGYPIVQGDFGLDETKCFLPQMGPVTYVSTRIDAPQNIVDGNKNCLDWIHATGEELNALLKSGPPQSRIIAMVKHLLNKMDMDGNNVLHLAFKQKYQSMTTRSARKLLLSVIRKYSLSQLINLQNFKGQTIVHIAIENQLLKDLEDDLILIDLSKQDNGGNTPLHYSVKYKNSTALLLKNAAGLTSCIEITNNDGYTALQLAINDNNLHLAQLLIDAKANINVVYGTTGNNLIQQAIRNVTLSCNTDLVAYLIKHTDIDLMHANYRGYNCLNIADKIELDQISNLIREKLDDMGISLPVKEEVESGSESEDNVVDEVDRFKWLVLTEEDKRSMFDNIQSFTPKCLSQLAKLIETSGQLNKISSVLDMDHILNTNLLQEEKSVEIFLKLCLTNGISVYKIREVIEDLHLLDAVQCIDEMLLE